MDRYGTQIAYLPGAKLISLKETGPKIATLLQGQGRLGYFSSELRPANVYFSKFRNVFTL